MTASCASAARKPGGTAISGMILDASALLAFLLAEAGKERVAEALIEGAVMTTVNFAEVVTKYVLRGAKERAATLLAARIR